MILQKNANQDGSDYQLFAIEDKRQVYVIDIVGVRFYKIHAAIQKFGILKVPFFLTQKHQL